MFSQLSLVFLALSGLSLAAPIPERFADSTVACLVAPCPAAGPILHGRAELEDPVSSLAPAPSSVLATSIDSTPSGVSSAIAAPESTSVPAEGGDEVPDCEDPEESAPVSSDVPTASDIEAAPIPSTVPTASEIEDAPVSSTVPTAISSSPDAEPTASAPAVPVPEASEPADPSSDFALQNGKDAQTLNARFATLTKDSACTLPEDAQGCVDGGFAQCIAGKWVSLGCGAETQCFALPLVNKAGTAVSCTRVDDAAARFTTSGVTGGPTGKA